MENAIPFSISTLARMSAPVFAVCLFGGIAQATEPTMHGYAELSGCSDDGISGFASLVEQPSDQGVKEVDIYLQIDGISPGAHGVHIHENASCKPCGDAGGHFDPGPNPNSNPDGNHPFHMGDLVNVVANPDGVGVMATTTSRVTLSRGPLSVFDANGSAFIVHVNEDTFCPDGVTAGCAGGARAACGIIRASAAPESLQIAVSKKSYRNRATPLNRGTLRGRAYIFLAPEYPSADIASVDFFMNGRYVKRENYAPYDLLGTRSGGRGAALRTQDMSDGSHTVGAIIRDRAGNTTYRAAKFEVGNDSDLANEPHHHHRDD